MYDGKERRKYRRVKARVSVEIEQYESAPMLLTTSDAASKNVSAGGLLFPLPPGGGFGSPPLEGGGLGWG